MTSIAKPRSISQLPGPKGLPVLGNLLQIDLLKLHSILENWSETYGGIFKFKVAGKTILGISDTELIQQILRERPETFRRVSSIESIAGELGANGIFGAEGEQWQQQRAIVTKGFKAENLQHFYPKLRRLTGRLQERWSDLAATDVMIDILDEWMRFTVSVTTHYIFANDDQQLLEMEGEFFQQHLKKFLPVFNRRANAPFPYWHYIKLPSERAMERSLEIIKTMIKAFVATARTRWAEQSPAGQPANFMETLLLAQNDPETNFSELDMLGNIINIMLAGEDTTAHTLSWLVCLMTENPEIQRNIQEEVDAVLGNESTPPTIDTVEQLPYTAAVIHETLRLKSVTPIFFFEPTRDVELAGIAIPKGTFLMIASRYGALQEKNFSKAGEFNPERWLSPGATGCPHNRNASMPFGAGPRFCPGRNLALLEIKTAMAMLCKNFTVIRADAGRPVNEVFSFTMMPDQLPVRLIPR